MEGKAIWIRALMMRRNFIYRVQESRYPSTLEEETCEFIRERVDRMKSWE